MDEVELKMSEVGRPAAGGRASKYDARYDAWIPETRNT